MSELFNKEWVRISVSFLDIPEYFQFLLISRITKNTLFGFNIHVRYETVPRNICWCFLIILEGKIFYFKCTAFTQPLKYIHFSFLNAYIHAFVAVKPCSHIHKTTIYICSPPWCHWHIRAKWCWQGAADGWNQKLLYPCAARKFTSCN